MNCVSLLGRIVNELELKKTKNSALSVVDFCLACEDSQYQDTEFINCVALGKNAENLYQYQGKGNLIELKGFIQNKRYEKDDKTYYSVKVIASSIRYLEKKRQNETNMNYEYGGIEDDF